MAAVNPVPVEYHQMVYTAIGNTAKQRNELRSSLRSLDPNEEKKILILSQLAGVALTQMKENIEERIDSPYRRGKKLKPEEVQKKAIEEVKSDIQEVIHLIAAKGFNVMSDETYNPLYQQICKEYDKIKRPKREDVAKTAIIRELEGVIQTLEGAMIVNPPWKDSVRMEPHYTVGVFGSRHEAMTEYPKIPISEVYSQYHVFVHPVIANILDNLNKRKDLGTTTGLFRLSPSAGLLQQLLEDLKHGNMQQLREGVPDIHLLTVALKTVINTQFENQLISGELKNELMDRWNEMKGKSQEEQVATFRKVMNSEDVDRSTRETVKSVICFFNGLIQFADTTKMNASNLGIVLAPNLIEVSNDPQVMMSEMLELNQMTAFLIENYKTIFE